MSPLPPRVASLLFAFGIASFGSACVLGCGGSKEPAYFALAPQPGPAQPGAPSLIELRRPGVAGYLDRADIVTKVKDYQLQVDTSERWAEPLSDMIGRVVAQNLSSRLSESQVFVENGAISALPEVVVAVDIQSLVEGSDGEVSLVAQVVLETPNSKAPARAKRFSLHQKPATGDTAGQVASMSALLGELSDGIATMLRQR